MFHHRRADEDPGNSVFAKWYLLAFLAGNVNAGGFLAAGRFVTHVTGFATLFGIDVAHQEWDKATGILLVPAFFLIGAMISAYMVDRRYHRGHRPHYDWVMLMIALCLSTAAIGGHLEWFGVFGEQLKLKQDFILLALLCMASGLQNAAVTSATGSRVRTTHLTGLTTDLGIGLVRTWALWHNSKACHDELRANWFRGGTILSYFAGSVIGAILFMKVQYLGFFLPTSIALYAFYQARLEFARELAAEQTQKPATKAQVMSNVIPLSRD